jgi:CRP/FNR family transcriptional regulator, cyclic AMP receptor protein
MALPEALGFLASGLVLLTFGMRTMLPMRLLAICSNLAFISYGLSLGLTPVWALHGILLPLNLYRLRELRQQACRGESAPPGERYLEQLLPVVARRPFAAGEVLFREGESAHELVYILNGRVRLQGLDTTLGVGEPLSALSVRWTATAVCATDGELLVISDTPRAWRPAPLHPQPVHQEPAERPLPDLASWFPLAAWARRRSA